MRKVIGVCLIAGVGMAGQIARKDVQEVPSTQVVVEKEEAKKAGPRKSAAKRAMEEQIVQRKGAAKKVVED